MKTQTRKPFRHLSKYERDHIEKHLTSPVDIAHILCRYSIARHVGVPKSKIIVIQLYERMHFNPADIQTIGVGLAAFLATLAGVFVFLSARKESLGRAILYVLGAMSLWAWFGFFYETVSSLSLARDMRIVSVIGIVLIALSTLSFSIVYMQERVTLAHWGTKLIAVLSSCGVLLIIGLLTDLLGTKLFVGDLLQSPSQVLAPNAGPIFWLVIVYYSFCTLLSAVLLGIRTRASTDTADRRRVELISMSLILALVLGGTRFAPWYGIDSYPILGMFAGPLFIFTAFYTIKRYKLFNVEIAIAQLFIFLLWTFTFFRMLVGLKTPTANIDIGFFIAVLVLGIFLLHSMVLEMRLQKKLTRLILEQNKSEFATIVAHELREPFSSIQSIFTHLSSSADGTLSEKQKEYVQQGRTTSNQLMSLLDNLLNVVHISQGTLYYRIEPGDVREAVRSGTNIFEEALKNKNIHCSIILPSEPLRAHFDRGKLAFAIENVFDNAIKYSPKGGSVSVQAQRENEKIIVTITDSGIGIQKADLDRIFEKFFRGEEAMRTVPIGSGLGLYLTKCIIEAHCGAIEVTSPSGGGTIVTISLPVSVH